MGLNHPTKKFPSESSISQWFHILIVRFDIHVQQWLPFQFIHIPLEVHVADKNIWQWCSHIKETIIIINILPLEQCEIGKRKCFFSTFIGQSRN